MKKVKLYTLLAGLALFASCEKFLEKQPPHNLTLENAVTTYAGAENALNGMYATVQNGNLGGALMMPLSAMAGFYVGDYSIPYNIKQTRKQ